MRYIHPCTRVGDAVLHNYTQLVFYQQTIDNANKYSMSRYDTIINEAQYYNYYIYRRKINVRGDDNTEDKFTRTCGIESKSISIAKNRYSILIRGIESKSRNIIKN